MQARSLQHPEPIGQLPGTLLRLNHSGQPPDPRARTRAASQATSGEATASLEKKEDSVSPEKQQSWLPFIEHLVYATQTQ